MPMTDEAFEKIVSLTRVKRVDAPADEEAEDGAPLIAVDDVVEVSEGPFKGMQGPVLERTTNEEQAALTLVLTVMGRDTPVTVPESYCSKVASSV